MEVQVVTKMAATVRTRSKMKKIEYKMEVPAFDVSKSVKLDLSSRVSEVDLFATGDLLSVL